MANDDSLQNTIGRAKEEMGPEETSVSGNRNAGEKRFTKSLQVLVTILVASAAFKFFVVDDRARLIEQDLAVSALDLFMEADASVVIFYTENRLLPEGLPAAALSPFVVYERLDADRYSLQVIYPPHDATVERNVANIAPPRNLESLLNL